MTFTGACDGCSQHSDSLTENPLAGWLCVDCLDGNLTGRPLDDDYGESYPTPPNTRGRQSHTPSAPRTVGAYRFGDVMHDALQLT